MFSIHSHSYLAFAGKAPPIANNYTEVGLDNTSNDSHSSNVNYTAITSAVVPVALVVVILMTCAVIGLGRCALQWLKERRGNQDPDADNEYNPYIYMEESHVPGRPHLDRHKSSDPDAAYVDVARQMTLKQQVQEYEVPRTASQESIEVDEQHHQYENHNSWVDGQLPEYENHEVLRRPSQEKERRRNVSKKVCDYENQEIIEAYFQSLECLDSLSSSYIHPNPLPSGETQPHTNCTRPPSQVHSYVNTPHSKSRPSKSVDSHNYITVVN